MEKIAIMTWHYYNNFGSSLQAYALQEVIESLGMTVKIINYRNIKYGKESPTKEALRYLFSVISPGLRLGKRELYFPFLLFQRSYLHQTKLIQDETKLKKYARHFDAFICGSDQIWAPNVYNPVYFLDYVPNNKKKVSYAASIGLNNVPEDLISEYYKHLKGFSSISLREKSGAKLLKDKCGIKATVVLDPTFLLTADKWELIEKKPIQHNEKPFLFCYFLNSSHKYKETVLEYAHEKGLSIFGYSANEGDSLWMDIKYQRIGPQEFLWLIHNSNAVLTDSYHGTIFSLLYHKVFHTFERFNNDDVICQNSRIYQLCDWFGINQQIIQTPCGVKISDARFDYHMFEQKLALAREASYAFLRHALKG